MIYFVDETNKVYYIMAPKCGNTTITKFLNCDLHDEPDLSNINNTDYKIIIIIRKNVVGRFLSGFYEDLFNNTCYETIDATFYDYILFLYKCFQEKLPDVNSMTIKNKDIPLWWGNCSNVSSPITDIKGIFCSHIMSQKYAISNIVGLIQNSNVEIIELGRLNSITNIHENKKEKIHDLTEPDFSELSLSYIKKNRIIVSEKLLNDKLREIITDMYKEDIIYMNELELKYPRNTT